MYKKGYRNDAGYDIILYDDVTIKPGHSVIDLKHTIAVARNEVAFIVPRSSFGSRLLMSLVPIDTDYSGELHAFVFNTTSKNIVVKKGSAFCQLVIFKLGSSTVNHIIKKEGKRNDNAFGSTNEL